MFIYFQNIWAHSLYVLVGSTLLNEVIKFNALVDKRSYLFSLSLNFLKDCHLKCGNVYGHFYLQLRNKLTKRYKD